MKCSRLELFQFALPVARPLFFNGKNASHREGLIVKLTADDASYGYGEISPLPGFSPETSKDAAGQLTKVKDQLLRAELPRHPENLGGDMERWLGSSHLFASVRCGLEMALLNLTAFKKNLSVSQLLSKSQCSSVPVAGLLAGSDEDVLNEAQSMVDQSFKAVKLKVGKSKIQEDILIIKKVGEVVSDKALLRLDANRQWDINQAVELGNEIGCAAVEYIEEPFNDLTKLEEFLMKTTIPVALDESLLKMKIQDVNALPGVDVLILKPTMLGGIEKTWQWIQQAQRLAIRTIVSSSFESGVGISFLANLAACSHLLHPVGLDTLKYFKEDLLQYPIELSKGNMPVRTAVRDEHLKTSLMNKIF